MNERINKYESGIELSAEEVQLIMAFRKEKEKEKEKQENLSKAIKQIREGIELFKSYGGILYMYDNEYHVYSSVSINEGQTTNDCIYFEYN